MLLLDPRSTAIIYVHRPCSHGKKGKQSRTHARTTHARSPHAASTPHAHRHLPLPLTLTLYPPRPVRTTQGKQGSPGPSAKLNHDPTAPHPVPSRQGETQVGCDVLRSLPSCLCARQGMQVHSPRLVRPWVEATAPRNELDGHLVSHRQCVVSMRPASSRFLDRPRLFRRLSPVVNPFQPLSPQTTIQHEVNGKATRRYRHGSKVWLAPVVVHLPARVFPLHALCTRTHAHSATQPWICGWHAPLVKQSLGRGELTPVVKLRLGVVLMRVKVFVLVGVWLA